jgi:hypothetical protein
MRFTIEMFTNPVAPDLTEQVKTMSTFYTFPVVNEDFSGSVLHQIVLMVPIEQRGDSYMSYIVERAPDVAAQPYEAFSTGGGN